MTISIHLTLPKIVSQIVFRCSPSTFNDAKRENPNVLKIAFSVTVGRATYTTEMSNEISFCTRTKKPNAANNLTFFMSFLGAIQSWFSRTALFKMEMERPAEHKCRLLQVETIEFDSDLGHRIIPLLISFTVSLVRPNRLKCAAFDASTLYIFKCVSVYLPSIIFYLSMIISVYCVRQIFILLSIQHL